MKLAIKEDGIYIDGEKLDLRKCTEINIKGINPIEDAEVSIRICPDEVEIDTLPCVLRRIFKG